MVGSSLILVHNNRNKLFWLKLDVKQSMKARILHLYNDDRSSSISSILATQKQMQVPSKHWWNTTFHVRTTKIMEQVWSNGESEAK